MYYLCLISFLIKLSIGHNLVVWISSQFWPYCEFAQKLRTISFEIPRKTHNCTQRNLFAIYLPLTVKFDASHDFIWRKKILLYFRVSKLWISYERKKKMPTTVRITCKLYDSKNEIKHVLKSSKPRAFECFVNFFFLNRRTLM